MANCAKCGRKLSGFSFGKQRNICKWCVQHEAAQRGELPEDDIQPVMTVPWKRSTTDTMFLTQLFVVMNVLVFIAMVISGVSITDPTGQELIRWGSNYVPRTLGGEWWRLLTSVFLHIGVIHLLLNMWCLWSLGEMAESLYGHWMFLCIYLISGISGSLLSAWWRPNGLSAGASGAIFGIAGALIASYYLGDFSLPQSVVRASLRSVVTFAGYNLLFGFVSGRVDNAAHIGGLLGGFAMGAMIARGAPDSEGSLRRFGIVVAALAVVAGCAAYLEHSRAYDIYMRSGFSSLSDRNVSGAIAEFKKAVHARPKDTSARIQLARAYLLKSQYSEADTELQNLSAANPKDEYVLYQVGNTYLAGQQTAKAKDTFLQLVSANPSSAYGHYGLGSVAVRENKDQIAIEEYTRAVTINPEFSSSYYSIGLAHARLKQYDQAIAAFLKLRELDDDDEENETALADAYAAKGMTNEAQQAKDKAAQLRADDN